MLRKFIVIFLCLTISTLSLSARSETQPLSSEAGPTVQHLFIDPPVQNIVVLCDQEDFKKEAAEFRDFRIKYGLFWSGIISVLIYYAYTRTH